MVPGRCWDAPGGFWEVPEGSWAVPGRSWGVSGGCLEGVWGVLGVPLGYPWGLEALWEVLGRFGSSLGGSWKLPFSFLLEVNLRLV